MHTGVKSLGCEKRTAQPSPIHSWKLIVPCVVFAVKFGAVSLMRRDDMVVSFELESWPAVVAQRRVLHAVNTARVVARPGAGRSAPLAEAVARDAHLLIRSPSYGDYVAIDPRRPRQPRPLSGKQVLFARVCLRARRARSPTR